MHITIDDNSGFCFGVVNVIKKAEEELKTAGKLFCLGHIVHNQAEVERLEKSGLITINHEGLKQLHDCTVLIRAHGEPPETYKIARGNNIQLIDATCPVVLKLQQRVKKSFEEQGETGQVIIFGKKGHAEVNGLIGQTGGKAVVLSNVNELDKIEPTKSLSLFSQTTMDIEAFQQLSQKLKEKFCDAESKKLKINDTICRQVANRAPHLRKFATEHDIIVFVSGKDSSNGHYLFSVCREINPDSHFVSSPNEIDAEWFLQKKSLGICGATSTPLWQMVEVAQKIKSMTKQD